MRGRVDFLQFLDAHLGIDFSRRELAMTEHGLNEPDVGPVVVHQRCHRVAKEVARATLAHVRPLNVAAYQQRKLIGPEGWSGRGGSYAGLCAILGLRAARTNHHHVGLIRL